MPDPVIEALREIAPVTRGQVAEAIVTCAQ
jgi:TusA-related sulfurtransferase